MKDKVDFSYLDEDYEIYSIKNEKVIGEYKLETPKIVRTDEFVALWSKMYECKSADDDKNKSRGISKSHSENIKFEE